MPRPKSLYERFTKATIPPPEEFEAQHLVIEGEHAIGIANAEYRLEEYDPDRWREMLLYNEIDNPFLLDVPVEEGGVAGTIIRIPPTPLPTFD